MLYSAFSGIILTTIIPYIACNPVCDVLLIPLGPQKFVLAILTGMGGKFFLHANNNRRLHRRRITIEEIYSEMKVRNDILRKNLVDLVVKVDIDKMPYQGNWFLYDLMK